MITAIEKFHDPSSIPCVIAKKERERAFDGVLGTRFEPEPTVHRHLLNGEIVPKKTCDSTIAVGSLVIEETSRAIVTLKKDIELENEKKKKKKEEER